MIISMASHKNLNPKHKKLQNQDSDIFDALPKHLVSQILSLLPTEDAIRTSILAKRWRFRWTTISNLNFSDAKICDLATFDEDEDESSISVNPLIKCFIDSVNNVLLRLESTSVDRFSIFFDYCEDRLQIENWISAAVKLNVRVLSLSAQSINENPIDLPHQVFNCKSLEALSLSSGVFVNIPKQESACFPNLEFLSLECVSICGIPACFPKLKTLHLRNVHFVGNDECVMKLIRNCPILEDLLIGRTIESNSANIDMCIRVLTTVELDLGNIRVGAKLEIEAPIKNLRLISFNPTHKVFVKNPGSLITAEVRMSNVNTEFYEAEQKENVFKLVKTLEKVKCLNIGCYTITVIRASQIELPLFCNLIRLQVQLQCKNLCVLHCLLNNSYNLQTLVVEKFDPPCYINDEQWMEFSDVPKCFLTSLKWVEVHGFDGCTHRLDMVKNMLRCAETLKKLTIKYSSMSTPRDMSSLRRKILTFPRASAASVVDFFIFVRRFGSYFWAKVFVASLLQFDLLMNLKESSIMNILSKGWRFRWTTISNLNFSDEKICGLANFTEDGNSIDEDSVKALIVRFIDYVNNVLIQFEPTSVDKFTIFFEDCNDRLQIENWISAAVKLNVRVLSLSAYSIDENPIDLPHQVFNCKSLESLSLSTGVSLNIPKQEFSCFPNLKFLSLDCVNVCGFSANGKSASFPKLETLHLSYVEFVGEDECVMKLIRNCPVLKDLLICRTIESNSANIDMCIPVLTSVDLHFGHKNEGIKVEIKAPIKHLNIVSSNPTDKLFVQNPDSLITAGVYLNYIKTKDYAAEQRVLYDFQGEQKDNILHFMKTLENVKCLNLGCYTVAVIRASQIELPLFCNLICLHLQLHCKNLCALQCLLNSSNKLQTLVVEKNYQRCYIEVEPWMEFSHTPKCLLTSLKWVEIQGFDGCTHGFGMIKTILKSAKILKKFTAEFKFLSVRDMRKYAQKILTCPRASAACTFNLFYRR